MNKIERNEKVYALFGDANDTNNGTTFFGLPKERLQFSVLKYNKGRILRSHAHKCRPRVIERTQESWVVLKGKVRVLIFNEKKEIIHEQDMTSGQFYISYQGGHGYMILEDETIVIENKLGDFISVDADKEKF